MKNNSFVCYLQAFVFVAIYIGLGLVLKLGSSTYLLIGIPLTILFQLFVRKQPIQTLWVRDYSKFSLNKWGIFIAVGFIVYPVKKIINTILQNELNSTTILYGAAIIGSIGAAYSLCRFTKASIRHLLLCLATAGSIGILLFVVVAVARAIALHQPFNPSLLIGIKSLLINFPLCFIVEEVIFRGLIDSHVHQPQQTKGIASAIFVSALWGLWHLPVVAPNSTGHLLGATISIVVVHTILGIPLSIFWRRSGNLAVPAFSHALIDSIRNALLNHI